MYPNYIFNIRCKTCFIFWQRQYLIIIVKKSQQPGSEVEAKPILFTYLLKVYMTIKWIKIKPTKILIFQYLHST